MFFHSYIFVNTNIDNYSALKYTIGIKSLVRFWDSIPYMIDENTKAMQMAEKASKISPVVSKSHIDQDAIVFKGSFKVKEV